MGKFVKIDKKALTMGQHFSFTIAFDDIVAELETESQKIVAARSALHQARQKEDECLKLAQGSEWTAKIKSADLDRDHNYGWLKRIVAIWVESGLEPEATAAAGLQRLIKLYKIDVNSQIDEESGLMDNFLSDVAASQTLTTALDTLNVRRFYTGMATANLQVKDMLAERGRESSGKVAGALKAARAETDAAYNTLCELLESYSLVADDPAPYEAIISEWNATIERYKDMLKRKSTKDTPDDVTPVPASEPTPVEPETPAEA